MNNEKLEAGLASDLNRELDTTSDDCKLCGSNCNERDELIKCEREITRLQAYVTTLKATIEREAEYCYSWAASAEMMGDDDRAKRHRERGDRLMSSV
jgi:hypothetical protein